MSDFPARAPTSGEPGAIRDVLLQPGDYLVGDASHRLRTVLALCVSVTLSNQRDCVGAMSHSLLASRGGAAPGLGKARNRALSALDGRYGDEALSLMLDEPALRNITSANCKAKISGGGNMFPTQSTTGGMATGRCNGYAARDLLKATGIEVLSESLFGNGHRQIMFEIATTDVWVRQLSPVASPDTPPSRSCA